MKIEPIKILASYNQKGYWLLHGLQNADIKTSHCLVKIPSIETGNALLLLTTYCIIVLTTT